MALVLVETSEDSHMIYYSQHIIDDTRLNGILKRLSIEKDILTDSKDITFNFWHSDSDPKDVLGTLAIAVRSTNLQKLVVDLGSTRYSTDVIIESLRLISTIPNLQLLNLNIRQTNLESFHLPLVKKTIGSMKTLTSLQLSIGYNHIFNEGSLEFCDLIESLTTLKHLHLGLSFSRNQGKHLMSILSALRKNQNLISFGMSLWGNRQELPQLICVGDKFLMLRSLLYLSLDFKGMNADENMIVLAFKSLLRLKELRYLHFDCRGNNLNSSKAEDISIMGKKFKSYKNFIVLNIFKS